MRILVTGAKGFVGRNLIVTLKRIEGIEIYQYDIDTASDLLDTYTKDCDFVFHLAGVNRPRDEEEFKTGNPGLTNRLINFLKENKNSCPVLITSSTQAALENLYGKSKKEAEDLIFAYGKEIGSKVLVYRLPNVFGKWCRPNYNSAVATFCYNIARGLPIKVNNPDVIMNLVYIDDVLEEMLNALKGNETRDGEFCKTPIVHTKRLGDIVDLIYSFKESRGDLSIPDMADGFSKKLYAAYLTYIPEGQFNYPLKMNIDSRGSFTEFIRTPERGQVSVNISQPGITKGNHWHHSKNEKFLVVSGRGVIRFRQIDTDEIIEYYVSGEKLEVVDIPPGYTHNIENLGETDMVTVMWANEPFDPDKPDTYYLEV